MGYDVTKGSQIPVDAPVAADEDRLLTVTVRFLEEGFCCREPGIVIATERQRCAILERLAAQIDVEHARRVGELTVLDVQDLYDKVFVDGVPNADRLTRCLGDVIDGALRRHDATLVRVYDGMVEWLWRRGNLDAASQLETLIYGLARTHPFSLLSAHAMRDFYKQTHRSEGQAPGVQLSDRAWPLPVETGRLLEPVITRREGDVLRRTALGHANKTIANALNISVRTVEAHKANAMRKLGLAERADVIRFAVSKGWLTK